MQRSLLEAETFLEEIPIHPEENAGEEEQDRGTDEDGHIARAEEAVPETVDNVENGVRERQCLPEGRERVDGVEHAAEIDKRGEHEGRNNRDAVKALGVDAVNEPAEREHERGEEEEKKKT